MSPRTLRTRAILALAGSATVAAVLITSTAAQAVDATIPPGGVSVSSLTPATGGLVNTPTFGGVSCPATATQVSGAFYGGTGAGEILETNPALASTYVIGEPERFGGFGINALIAQRGIAPAALAGRYTYRLTCVDDFGVPIPAATVYYALVDVTPTAYTFVPPVGGTPTTTTAPATTTTAPATTTTAPATTTTAPATTTTAPATTTTRSTTTAPATTTTAPATTTTAPATTTTRSTTTAPATVAPTTTATTRPGSLASTGASGIATLVVIAVGLCLLGAGFLLSTRRRFIPGLRRG